MGIAKRKLTTAFKQQIVEEIISGRSSSSMLCRRYNLAANQISEWMDAYEEGRLGYVVNTIEDDPVYMRTRISELERIVGKLSLENADLKKASNFILERRRARTSMLSGKIMEPSKKLAGS